MTKESGIIAQVAPQNHYLLLAADEPVTDEQALALFREAAVSIPEPSVMVPVLDLKHERAWWGVRTLSGLTFGPADWESALAEFHIRAKRHGAA